MISAGLKATIRVGPAETLLKRARELGFEGVEVGVFGSEQTAKIAAIHENGTKRIPKRSFIRATMKQRGKHYRAKFKTAMENWTAGADLDKELLIIGNQLASDIRKTIIRGIKPALADSTIASKKRRGLAKPHVALYATGALYNAIKARIAKGKGKRG
jgi:hypothetical protein